MRRSFAMIWWAAKHRGDRLQQVAGPDHLDLRAVVQHERSPRARPAGSASSTGTDGRNRIRCSALSALTRPAGESSATTSPWSITATRSQSRDSLLHEVGDQHDRDAGVADRLDQVPGVAAGLRVEPGGELVEDRDARAADERERDRQPLLAAAGELAVTGVELVVRGRGLAARLPPDPGPGMD
jgi:hypothetical protein